MRARNLLFLAILFLPLVAEAAGAPRTFKELADQTYTILSAGIATLVALGIVIYIWGIASDMTKLSEGDGKAYRARIFWGIIIIFVMVSVVGIVRLLGTTFFQGGGGQAPQQQAPASGLFNA